MSHNSFSLRGKKGFVQFKKAFLICPSRKKSKWCRNKNVIFQLIKVGSTVGTNDVNLKDEACFLNDNATEKRSYTQCSLWHEAVDCLLSFLANG